MSCGFSLTYSFVMYRRFYRIGGQGLTSTIFSYNEILEFYHGCTKVVKPIGDACNYFALDLYYSAYG